MFVFPNDFAPSGLLGICTIIQHVFKLNIGYLTIISNIPLLALAFLLLNRNFAIKNAIYVFIFSLFSLFLDQFDLTSFSLIAKDGGEKMMAAIAAGLFNGLIYSSAIKIGGCTGGIDIIAAFVNKKKPEFSVVWIIFALNIAVATLSFFTFGRQFIPSILCIIYSLVASRISDSILKGSHAAAKVEIITSDPETISHRLMEELKHGCTVIPAKGMYSNNTKSLLVCVVNKMQITQFEKILKDYPDCFVIVSSVNNTFGNFKHVRTL